MHFDILIFSENTDDWWVSLVCSAIEIGSEEHCNFISLEIFFVTVEFFVIFEEIDIELKAASGIVLIKNVKKFFKNISICDFDSEEKENFYF